MAKPAPKKLNLKSHHHFLAGVIIAILLILLLWLAAVHYHWGPYKRKVTIPTTSEVTQPNAGSSATGTTNSGGSGSGSGATGSTGASGSNGSNGTNGTNGSTPTNPTPAAGTSIFNLYGSIGTGQTKQEVQAASNGLKENCVTVNSSIGGKQEACTYQEGDRLVTVTYLNDRVIGVSKAGF